MLRNFKCGKLVGQCPRPPGPAPEVTGVIDRLREWAPAGGAVHPPCREPGSPGSRESLCNLHRWLALVPGSCSALPAPEGFLNCGLWQLILISRSRVRISPHTKLRRYRALSFLGCWLPITVGMTWEKRPRQPCRSGPTASCTSTNIHRICGKTYANFPAHLKKERRPEAPKPLIIMEPMRRFELSTY